MKEKFKNFTKSLFYLRFFYSAYNFEGIFLDSERFSSRGENYITKEFFKVKNKVTSVFERNQWM